MSTAYQPKTGAKCSCKRGIQRDNCPTCEGTGYIIDFAAIRARPISTPTATTQTPCEHDYIVRDKDGYQFYTAQTCIHCGAQPTTPTHELEYVIQNKRNGLFWNNDDGWTEREGATVFSQAEHDHFDLPVDGQWNMTHDEGQVTPLPWYATNEHVQSVPIDEDGYVCKVEGVTQEQAEANAAFIVRAVNSHDAALSLAKHAQSVIDNWERGDLALAVQELSQTVQDFYAALATNDD